VRRVEFSVCPSKWFEAWWIDIRNIIPHCSSCACGSSLSLSLSRLLPLDPSSHTVLHTHTHIRVAQQVAFMYKYIASI
jgi:hypothetical protein